jgi:hypothetical protein
MGHATSIVIVLAIFRQTRPEWICSFEPPTGRLGASIIFFIFISKAVRSPHATWDSIAG